MFAEKDSDNLVKYDFVPVNSNDDIQKFWNLLAMGAAKFLPKIFGGAKAGKAVATGAKAGKAAGAATATAAVPKKVPEIPKAPAPEAPAPAAAAPEAPAPAAPAAGGTSMSEKMMMGSMLMPSGGGSSQESDAKQMADRAAQEASISTKSIPMEIAMRLLKEKVHPGENQYKHRYKMPNRDDVHPEWYDWIQETLDNPAEYEGIADDFQQPDINHLAGATSREEFFEKLYDLHNFQVDDARPPFDDIEGKYRDFTDVPFSEETGFTRSEPMEIAMRLLKKEPFYQQIRNNLIVDDGEDSPGEYPHDDFLQWAEEHYSRLHEDENHPEEYYNLLEAIELEKKRRAEGSFDGIGYNEETGFTRSEPMEITWDSLQKKLCPKGKAAAKRKFKVYPSAYANGYAVQVCQGKIGVGKKKGKKK